MRVIEIWAFTDSRLAYILAEMLHSDFEAGVGMYLALSGGEGKRAVLFAAARATLPPEDQLLFQAIMKLTKPARDRRNDFAHHIWGYSKDLPDAVMLVDPRYLVDTRVKGRKNTELAKEARAKGEQPVLLPADIDRSKVMVYRKADLEESLAHGNQVFGYVQQFWLMLRKVGAPPEHRRKMLLSRPPIQQALEHLSKQSG